MASISLRSYAVNPDPGDRRRRPPVRNRYMARQVPADNAEGGFRVLDATLTLTVTTIFAKATSYYPVTIMSLQCAHKNNKAASESSDINDPHHSHKLM